MRTTSKPKECQLGQRLRRSPEPRATGRPASVPSNATQTCLFEKRRLSRIMSSALRARVRRLGRALVEHRRPRAPGCMEQPGERRCLRRAPGHPSSSVSIVTVKLTPPSGCKTVAYRSVGSRTMNKCPTQSPLRSIAGLSAVVGGLIAAIGKPWGQDWVAHQARTRRAKSTRGRIQGASRTCAATPRNSLGRRMAHAGTRARRARATRGGFAVNDQLLIDAVTRMSGFSRLLPNGPPLVTLPTGGSANF